MILIFSVNYLFKLLFNMFVCAAALISLSLSLSQSWKDLPSDVRVGGASEPKGGGEDV